jgi:hypothetical protein
MDKVRQYLHADPSGNLVERCVILCFLASLFDGLVMTRLLRLSYFLVARREPFVLKVHLSGVFEAVYGLLDALCAEHKGSSREPAAGSCLELSNPLRLFAQYLEYAGQSADCQNLVLDGSSLELGRFRVHVERKRWR